MLTVTAKFGGVWPNTSGYNMGRVFPCEGGGGDPPYKPENPEIPLMDVKIPPFGEGIHP